MDDDGRPEGADCLAALLSKGSHLKADVTSPVIIDIDDSDVLAFPYPVGTGRTTRRSDLDGTEVIKHFAHLFNGALIRAEAFSRYGIPDYRLFFRGDETEVHRRLLRSGLPFGTCTAAAYLHPEGTTEFEPILGGRLSAQYPSNPVKRYFTYRNRGYLMAQPGMRWLLPLEFVRFSWFFLVSRNDPAGWRDWLRLTRSGRRERFTRP
jgi:rhamnopyranosyl-N-acetylglucosaminyl-diphospho-decaprenol beta-1,3/1,4-galactofuranosyltransferase